MHCAPNPQRDRHKIEPKDNNFKQRHKLAQFGKISGMYLSMRCRNETKRMHCDEKVAHQG